MKTTKSIDVNGLSTEESILSTEKAKEVLIKANKENVEKCRIEIQTVLDKHNCTLDISMVLKANQNIPVVNIIEKVK